MLTTDKCILPEEVCIALAAFYDVKIEWLTKVFMRLESIQEDHAKGRSIQFLSTLHGASVLVQATNQIEFYETAVEAWR
ncbi:hypothetical protein EBI00_07050 [Marinomonas hwangdonensis]|uniref:Uncharacterized protein n=1 Tax=Marinomonas hwangdonensis TaxID=1053647 RepID=A0A3M8Q6H1_9GAMM|nr:hypothetical protein [Marinomonas hwangdonensis]RNF51643.1 hypothetical protein EBI00_07050 [Marinomonas hwangdonensis]